MWQMVELSEVTESIRDGDHMPPQKSHDGAEQALLNANRELIERFEKKIQATLTRVWGEE